MPASVSPDLLTSAFFGIIAVVNVAMFGYVAFRALRIRNALLVPLYRNQSLWIGAVASYWVIVYVPLVTNPLQANASVSYFLFFWLLAGNVFFLAFYDTQVRVARDSDPLERDILGWRYLRLALLAIVAVGALWAIVAIVPAVSATGLPPIGQLILFTAGISPIYIPMSIVPATAILIGSKRSGNPVTKRQLRWSGITTSLFFLLIIVVIIFVSLWGGTVPLATPPGLLIAEVIISVLAFSMYKISKSLVLTSKFERL